MNKKDEMIEEFKELLSWYGGVQDFEFNMGTFWWTNEYGKTFTMIVQGVE
tara:strand:- start:277 stop:426 length:150 start_codon:yes stop_codon:yes gene_type:complete